MISARPTTARKAAFSVVNRAHGYARWQTHAAAAVTTVAKGTVMLHNLSVVRYVVIDATAQATAQINSQYSDLWTMWELV